MSRKIAIVAQCVGQKYVDMFNTHCRGNWNAYAAKIGAEIVLVDRPCPVAHARVAEASDSRDAGDAGL